MVFTLLMNVNQTVFKFKCTVQCTNWRAEVLSTSEEQLVPVSFCVPVVSQFALSCNRNDAHFRFPHSVLLIVNPLSFSLQNYIRGFKPPACINYFKRNTYLPP